MRVAEQQEASVKNRRKLAETTKGGLQALAVWHGSSLTYLTLIQDFDRCCLGCKGGIWKEGSPLVPGEASSTRSARPRQAVPHLMAAVHQGYGRVVGLNADLNVGGPYGARVPCRRHTTAWP